MSVSDSSLSRRDVLRAAGALGAAAVMGGAALGQVRPGLPGATPTSAPGEAASQPVQVPTRVFGRSGVKVSILALGGIFDILNNQVALHQALRHGVTYWDTANGYNGGNSELGIGNFLGENPQRRKDLFLVTKSGNHDAAGLDEHLALSLERMKTDHVEMFFIHNLKGAREIQQHGAEWKQWAQRQRDAGKIKLFGFSAHTRQEEAMLEAAKTDYIDGIMLTYNFRVMGKPRMKEAIAACHDAGIGLTAMKTMALRTNREPTTQPQEKALVDQLVAKGCSPEQGCLKVVWENPAIASICTLMPNLAILQADVQAATDGIALSAGDRRLMQEYAQATCGGYCAACGTCQDLAGGLPVPDVMRWLMYARSYGELARARQEFAQLPSAVRGALAGADFSAAQRRCPQGMPIAQLIRSACEELA